MRNKKIEEENARIRACNAEFAKLPVEKKRVVIARDALQQLAIKRYRAVPGYYLEGQASLDDAMTLSEAVMSMERCDVCAVGALFTSALAREGAQTVREAKKARGEVFSVVAGLNSPGRAIAQAGATPFEQLEALGLFTEAELRRMEYWFERKVISHRFDYFAETPAWWYNSQLDPAERLRRILQNIVNNGGEFDPGEMGSKMTEEATRAPVAEPEAL